MPFTEGDFTGNPVAMTDGQRKVTFDSPADFEDWLEEHCGDSLLGWHWCPA